jgi:hypothetical protein
LYHAFSIASTIKSRASLFDFRFGAKPHSSQTEVANHFELKIFFRL